MESGRGNVLDVLELFKNYGILFAGIVVVLGLALGLLNLLPWQLKSDALLEQKLIAQEIEQIQARNTQADLTQTQLTTSVQKLSEVVATLQQTEVDQQREIDNLSHAWDIPRPGR